MTGPPHAGTPPAAARQRAELRAYRDLYAAAPAGVAARHGIACIDLAGGVLMAVTSQAGSPLLCHAVGVGVGAPVTDEDLDRMDAFYAAHGGAYSVAASPAAGDLAARLRRRGFRERLAWMTFHRPAGPLRAPETRLRTAPAGPADAAVFGAIVAAAFAMPPDLAPWIAAAVGLPGWTCLLAWDGDEPVGAAAVVVDGDHAWFGFGATLPEHRGKGAQGALFAARAEVALAAGARHFVTETGVPAPGEGPGPSYRNMLRAGFREAGARPNYSSPPAASPPSASSTRERSTASWTSRRMVGTHTRSSAASSGGGPDAR